MILGWSSSKIVSGLTEHRPRRTLCEFPIRFYVKLSSAVGAILIEGPNRRTHIWKRTIQWLFHQNFVLIEQMVDFLWTLNFFLFWPIKQIRKKGGWNFKKNLLLWNYWANLNQTPPDTYLEENHPMTISSKFCSYWANGFRQEDFYGNFPWGPMLN
jgi:hypothetical protein